MISDQAAKYLWDARRASQRIVRFTTGRSYDDYLSDEMLRSAVERQFEIIGEAFAGLRRFDPKLADTIPNLARIVAFRNVLIHSYATVDDRLAWSVVQSDLTKLLALLDRLLGDTTDGQTDEP